MCVCVCVSYLIPGHLWLLVWSHVVFYIRTGDHFAVGDLSLLQMADFAAEAFPLITLLHGHRHGHLHAVCWVPEHITNKKIGKMLFGFPQWQNLTLLNKQTFMISPATPAEPERVCFERICLSIHDNIELSDSPNRPTLGHCVWNCVTAAFMVKVLGRPLLAAVVGILVKL